MNFYSSNLLTQETCPNTFDEPIHYPEMLDDYFFEEPDNHYKNDDFYMYQVISPTNQCENDDNYHFSNFCKNKKEKLNIIENDEDISENGMMKRKKNPKRKIYLSDDAVVFKNYYFSIFTKKKKFKKEIVKKIHDYMREYIGFPKMTRDEVRCSDLYFKHYESEKLKIIPFLKEKKAIIKEKFFISAQK